MKGPITSHRVIGAFAALLMLTGLAGCGTGGAGGSSSPTGTVSVLFTDAPSDEFAEINLTVTDIELRGGQGGPVRIFNGSRSFDLLALRNFSQLFSTADTVPAGTYTKVRLHLADIELVRKDAAGTVVSTTHPPLPANGKVDLLAPGGLTLAPAGALLVEIDIDADKSIVKTGNGGYRFRPVIKLAIVDQTSPMRLSRFSGVIEMLDRTNATFNLCNVRVATMHAHTDDDDNGNGNGNGNGRNDDDDDENDDDGMDDDDRACIAVTVLANGGIFDMNGDAADAAALSEGEMATVIGQVRNVADGGTTPASDDSDNDGDNDDDDGSRPGMANLALDAVAVQIGPPGTFESVRGTINSAVDADNRFTFTGDDGMPLTVQLQTDGADVLTRIFNRDGTEAGFMDIQPDLNAEIDGVTASGVLKSSLIVLGPAAGREMLDGTIESADAGAGTLVLMVGSTMECVAVGAKTDIFVIGSGADATSVTRGDFSSLAAQAAASVFGEDNTATGCFDAATVIVFAP